MQEVRGCEGLVNLRGDAEDGVKGRDRQMEWTETGLMR